MSAPWRLFSRARFVPRIEALFGIPAVAIALCVLPSLGAQEIPNWSTFTVQPSVAMGYTGYLVSYENPYSSPALVLVYTNTNTHVDMAYTTDGVNYTPVNLPPDFQLDCNQGYIDVCSPAAAVLNGILYIAYPNVNHGISVVSAVPDNAGSYSFTDLYTDNSVQLTSSPAMVIAPNNNLLIKYGTSNNPNVHNAGYITRYVPSTNTWSTYAMGGTANQATRSAMVVFDGTLYTIDKQNNSDNGTWVIQLDDNGLVVSGHQATGMYTPLGYSAAVFNGSVVVTFQGNGSAKDLWAFSTTTPSNYSSWSGHQYSTPVGATPIVGNWNNGLALAFQNHNAYELTTSFATQ